MPDSRRSGRLDELLTLVSPRVGVIRGLDRVRCAIEQPDPPVIYFAVLAHFDFQPANPLDRSATGKGETEQEAMAAAIGEAVKLYCALHPDPEEDASGRRIRSWEAKLRPCRTRSPLGGPVCERRLPVRQIR